MTRNDRRTRTAAITAVLLVILASSGAFLVAAAGATTVEVDPSEATVEEGEMKTFEIVAPDIAGEIGAGEIAVHVSDSNVATITDVEIRGEPGLYDVSTNADNSTVEMVYAMADTNETGAATVAEVTVLGKSSGTTEISAGSIERNDEILLVDEGGNSYGTFETSPVRVTVEAADTGSGSTSGGDTDPSETGTDGDQPSDGDGESDTDPEENGPDQPSADDGSNTNSDERDADSDRGSTLTEDRESDDGSPLADDDEPVDQTGFGVVPAVVGIVVATYLVNRRTRQGGGQ